MYVLVVSIPVAYGTEAQIWIVTDLGNSYELDGPPPERSPGFDTAPYLNTLVVDTAYSLTAGPPDAVAKFGDAGVVVDLPTYDASRTEMSGVIVREWGSGMDSMPLFASVLVGDLKMHGNITYLGPARVNATAMDILALCNAGMTNGTEVKCVDNYNGDIINATTLNGYGHILKPHDIGRTIIHVSGTTLPATYEVMFTCPECRAEARAFYGVGGEPFQTFGFKHYGNIKTLPPPYLHGAGNLTGLAWKSSRDGNNITYWDSDYTSCLASPTILPGSIISHICGTDELDAGTVESTTWRPLVPGMNVITFHNSSYIIISDPGVGAQLQIREGNPDDCCVGFEGSITHKAPKPGRPAVIIHDTDLHRLVIPYGGTVPASHNDHIITIQLAASNHTYSTPRLLAHSESSDIIYHGINYDERGTWPPYMVRFVEVRHMDFDLPHLDMNIELAGGNYTRDDWLRIVQMDIPVGPLADSEIYDIRNDKRLRTDTGAFKMWDGTIIATPYIQPWLNIQKSPIWEKYGIPLPKDKLLLVDVYGTIPMVKPTRLSGTYLSSIPCGLPGPSDVSDALNATSDVLGDGSYDIELLAFLLLTSRSGDIDENHILQHVYRASRTYLDYLDGDYQAGDQVHVPILDNRPYLCTTISPNILESQYLLYGLPYGDSYLSLGGREGTAYVKDKTTTYQYTTGVQSPRDGIIHMDISARIGASVGALLMSTHDGTTPSQWKNGTISVDATLTVKGNTIQLGSFEADSYDIAEEYYTIQNGTCYGRFVTTPDYSQYIVKTIAASADYGEHIPITLRIHANTANMAPLAGTSCGGGIIDEELMQFLLRVFTIDVR